VLEEYLHHSRSRRKQHCSWQKYELSEIIGRNCRDNIQSKYLCMDSVRVCVCKVDTLQQSDEFADVGLTAQRK